MAINFNDSYIGKQFNRLTVIRKVGVVKNKAKFTLWEFKCDCGNLCVAPLSVVVRNKKMSCGCYAKECRKKANLKHGCRNSRLYRIWTQMKTRCLNSKHVAYSRYAGRGIKICKRWLKFENFLKDMGHPPARELTLDRVNNNKGYYKQNCRWATRLQQNRNSRNNIQLTYLGKTQCLSAWAEEFNLPYRLFWDRLRRQGWEFNKALTEPLEESKSHSKLF